MRKITFTPDAYAEYLNWLATDRKIFMKITDLIREASRNPGKGIGKPELLKHEIAMRKCSHQPKMIIWLFHLAFEKQIIYK